MATLGKYELVREIGEGGMSTVYEAVDTRIGRTVALKVLTIPIYLSQAQREVLIARLMREARAAGRLSHPNIVTVFDVGEDDGHHYIAMERLEGVTLRERLNDGPLRTSEAIRILEGVAAALDAAHAQGVLHRDIKPGNVILLPDGRVKLTDFGVARQIDDATLTQAGSPIGTPAYMAPEQVRGEPATPASDRWALGVLLYEMLAGQLPFSGDNIPAVLHQVAYHPAPPLPGAPGKIQAVLNRALAKKPAQRYESARELAAAFRAAVAAAPVSLLKPGGRFGTRDPAPDLVPASPPSVPVGGPAVSPGTATSPAVPATVAAEAPVAEPIVEQRPVEPEARPVELVPDLAGAKGGEVAAAPPHRWRMPAWAWGLPVLALLALIPLLGQRSFLGRSAPPAAPVRRDLPRPANPAARQHPAKVEVTEVTPRPEVSSSSPSRSSPPRAETRRAPTTVPRSVQRPDTTRRSAPRAAERRAAPVRTAVRRTLMPAAPPARKRREVTPRRTTTTVRTARAAAPAPRRRSPTTRRQEAPGTGERSEPVRVASSGRRGRSHLNRSAEALNAQGYRLLRQGRHREAEPLLREAVRRKPGHAYAQYNLGWSLVAQGKAREALGPLRATARQQPHRWEPQRRLAQAYAQLGDSDRARAHSTRAQTLRSGRRSGTRSTARQARTSRARNDRSRTLRTRSPSQHDDQVVDIIPASSSDDRDRASRSDE